GNQPFGKASAFQFPHRYDPNVVGARRVAPATPWGVSGSARTIQSETNPTAADPFSPRPQPHIKVTIQKSPLLEGRTPAGGFVPVARFFQDFAGERVGGEDPGFEAFVLEVLEGVGGEAAQGLGREALAPVLLSQPVADFGGEPGDVRHGLETDASDRFSGVFDR